MRLHKTSWNLLALRQICIPAAASLLLAPCSMLTPGLAMAMLKIYKWKFRQEHFLLNFWIRFLTIARLAHSTRKFSCQSLCVCLPLWAPSYPLFLFLSCCAHLIAGPAARLGGCQTSNFGIPLPFILSRELTAIYSILHVRHFHVYSLCSVYKALVFSIVNFPPYLFLHTIKLHSNKFNFQ